MKRLTPSSTYNVFADLGFAPREATNLKLRSRLMSAIEALIVRRGLTQSEAAKLMNVSQPRMSNLMHGQIERFRVDSLLAMLSAAGAAVEVAVFLEGALLTPISTRASARPARSRPRSAARPRARPRGRSAA